MDKNKIALQLYSVRDDAQNDLYSVLKDVKAYGYSGVEFIHGLWGHDPLEVKGMCEEIGLVPLSAHVPFQDFLADMDGTVATYKALGVQYVAIPYLTEDLHIKLLLAAPGDTARPLPCRTRRIPIDAERLEALELRNWEQIGEFFAQVFRDARFPWSRFGRQPFRPEYACQIDDAFEVVD